LVKAAIEKFENKDSQGFGELLAPSASFDLVFSVPGLTSSVKGRDAIVEFLKVFFQPYDRIEFLEKNLYSTKNGRILFLEARGNFVLTGRDDPYKNIYVWVFEVSDQRITAIREYNNPLIVSEFFHIPLPQPTGSNAR
jgi:ketosteroid isomerase-like protein